MGNVLSNWIYLIAGESNELLGLTSAITGLAMTMTVLPSGFLSDRTEKRYILRLASVVGFMGLVVALLAQSLEMIFLALLFWGLFQGLNRPSVESLFADSVESGSRSEVYAWVHLVRQFGMAIGPLVNIGLFFILGDTWDLDVLKGVMIVGILISMASLIILALYDDRKSLGEESDRIVEVIPQEFDINSQNTNENNHNNNNNNNNSSRKNKSLIIIGVLMTSNLIIGFGAGMTIKFFPVFFMTIYALSPIFVQMIMAGTSILTGVTSIIAQHLSLRSGRAAMIFIVQGLATACLFIIATYPPIFILVPVFLARGSLMNASQPLSRSILMDVVPKKRRGIVNSVQALAWGLFWNVSAALGGFLIGVDNYALCFIITAVIYVLGTLPILTLIPLVNREKKAQKV
ncbi:MAG: MFS transporter [Candidatus Heimdallarchaeota archaeon]|nr:MFS transporter [Candidatus Heimdallarchaeota archaeon]